MKLSIIVPVYNMAADGKLEFCIRSLANQTIDDYEIIAVNDASTDNSLEVLFALKKEFGDKLKVITYEENLRQGGAKNVGIKASEAEWIAICDSDDWVAPDMYEKLFKKQEETGADVVACDYCLVHEHTFEKGPVAKNNTSDQAGVLDDEKHKKLLLDSGSMVLKIWKRAMVVDNDLWYPEKMFFEDNVMGPLWLLYCNHFEKLDETLYYYYQHDTSTVHETTTSKLHDRMKAMEILMDEAKKRGLYERYKAEFDYKFAEAYFITTLFSLMQSKTLKGERKAMIEELKNGLNKYVPNFRNNEYYRSRMGAEEKKLIDMAMASTARFMLYYDALHLYRRVRYGR